MTIGDCPLDGGEFETSPQTVHLIVEVLKLGSASHRAKQRVNFSFCLSHDPQFCSQKPHHGYLDL